MSYMEPRLRSLAPDVAETTVIDRLGHAWRDMEASTREFLAEKPSESRLLFLLVVSDVVVFLSWAIKGVVAPTAAAQALLPLEIGLWLAAALFARTFFMYVFAAVTWVVARAFGGVATPRETRAGIFWGAFVSAPFALASAVLAVVLNMGEGRWEILSNDIVSLPPYYFALVPFLWFVAQGIATANKFERFGWVFFALSLGTVAFSLAGVYLSA